MVEHIGEVTPGEHPSPHSKYILRMQRHFLITQERFFNPQKALLHLPLSREWTTM